METGVGGTVSLSSYTIHIAGLSRSSNYPCSADRMQAPAEIAAVTGADSQSGAT